MCKDTHFHTLPISAVHTMQITDVSNIQRITVQTLLLSLSGYFQCSLMSTATFRFKKPQLGYVGN